MCTGLTLSTNEKYHFFGRNLDVPTTYQQHILVVPRQYQWENSVMNEMMQSRYSCIGMGIVINQHPLLFDAVNEVGLAGAGLNFTRYAKFSDKISSKQNVSGSNVLYWALSQFKTIEELKVALQDLVITNTEVVKGLEVAKLHWMFTDLSGKSIVVEYTKEGIQVFDNPVGVLTNDPGFKWHMTNLNHYVTLNANSPEAMDMDDYQIRPFGHGSGRFGIPGDGTPASRFIRTAFYKQTTIAEEGEIEGVTAFLKILDQVSIPKGSEIGPRGEMNHTLYQSVMCQESKTYYYTDYNNRRLNAVKLTEQLSSISQITIYSYLNAQDINYQN